MAEKIIEEAKTKMTKALDVLKQELMTIKTGRAAPGLVEGIEVEAYGGKYRLIELAQINVPEIHQLVIQPYDPGIIGEIKRAIEKAQLGLAPVIDGEILRIQIPPLTEERRAELVKSVRQRVEGVRIMIRQIRQEIMDEIEKSFKEKKLTEDDRFRFRDQIQKVVEEMNEKIEQMSQAKEHELMVV